MAAHGKWERRESHRAAGVFSFRDRHVEELLPCELLKRVLSRRDEPLFLARPERCGFQRFIAKPDAFHRPGAEVLDDHIGARVSALADCGSVLAKRRTWWLLEVA